jgi:6-pyruvoyl-tetrahydropterin synthase
MHDDGLKDRLSNTATNDMGINYDSLMHLIEKQQVVLLLDGFDEMGYVGSREHRLQHFDSIWRLATQGNKIIIAGRPSYFFGEQELNKALAVDANDLIADDLPHCHLIKFQNLSAEEIEEYLQKYFSLQEVVKYLAFIQSHKQLFDLAARPSLMHIIREMIAEVYADNQEQYSAATLMEKYAHHWIIRQDKKEITGSLSKNDKPAFFEKLAEWFYLNETEVIEHSKVEELMQQFLKHIDFSDKDTKDGILGDILSGSFLQRQINNYQFVHRSFFEYFVAKRIVTYIEKESSKKGFPEIFFKLWRQEIAAFVADLSPRGALPSNLEENRFYNQSKSLLEDLSQVELERKQPISANIFSRLFSNLTSQLKLISLENEFRQFSRILVSEDKGCMTFRQFSIRFRSLIRSDEVVQTLLLVSSAMTFLLALATFPDDVDDVSDFSKLLFVDTNIANILAVIAVVAAAVAVFTFIQKLKKMTNTTSQSIQLFKTALINNINVRFYQQAPTKEFINNALFIFLKKHFFTKALANHDFSGWNLEGVDLSEAELQGANFSNAKLRNVNFENANLQNVNFENADLTEAKLKNAKLKNAKLEGADLTGTMLENT